MTTYQINFETADGSIEDYSTDTNKARAVKIARNAAKTSDLIATFEITRFLVEINGQTIEAYEVAA